MYKVSLNTHTFSEFRGRREESKSRARRPFTKTIFNIIIVMSVRVLIQQVMRWVGLTVKTLSLSLVSRGTDNKKSQMYF